MYTPEGYNYLYKYNYPYRARATCVPDAPAREFADATSSSSAAEERHAIDFTMGAGESRLLDAPLPPPPPPPLPHQTPPPANDVPAALAEAGPVLARLATAVVTSPRFVLLVTLVAIGVAVRHEGGLTSSTCILALFSAVMGLHATTPTAPTAADESWLGFDPMSPAALGLVACALAVAPLYRDGSRATLRCVGFVAAFLLVQSAIEAAQLLADRAAWVLTLAGGWGAAQLALRAVAALLISRQVVAALPAGRLPRPPLPPADAAPDAALTSLVGRVAGGFYGLTRQLTQPFAVEKQGGSSWSFRPGLSKLSSRDMRSSIIDERQACPRKVNGAVLEAGPRPAITGSFGWSRRLEAALRAREKRPGTLDSTEDTGRAGDGTLSPPSGDAHIAPHDLYQPVAVGGTLYDASCRVPRATPRRRTLRPPVRPALATPMVHLLRGR